MSKLQPVIAYFFLTDGTSETLSALSISELYKKIATYTKEVLKDNGSIFGGIPSQEEIQTKYEKSTASVFVCCPDLGENIQEFFIMRLSEEFSNELIKPFIDQVRKLATEWNSVIGHPENPFPENVIEKMVNESFALIGESVPNRIDYEKENEEE